MPTSTAPKEIRERFLLHSEKREPMSSVALNTRRGAGFLAEVDDGEDEDDGVDSSAVAGGCE